jgi:hypothetical protein
MAMTARRAVVDEAWFKLTKHADILCAWCLQGGMAPTGVPIGRSSPQLRDRPIARPPSLSFLERAVAGCHQAI